MRTLEVVVIDDASHVGTAVETWLERGGANPKPTGEPFNANVLTCGNLADLLGDLVQGYTYDVALVDLLVEKGKGGPAIIAALQEHTPKTRVLLHSGVNEAGDRLFYTLAALSFFPEIVGILPKSLTLSRPGSSPGETFAGLIAAAADGSYHDETTAALRATCLDAFEQCLADTEDLRRWRAVCAYAEQRSAVDHLPGVSRQTLGGWVTDKLDLVELIWDNASEIEHLALTPGAYARGKAPYALLHRFANLQTYFWDDEYVASRLPQAAPPAKRQRGAR